MRRPSSEGEGVQKVPLSDKAEYEGNYEPARSLITLAQRIAP